MQEWTLKMKEVRLSGFVGV